MFSINDLIDEYINFIKEGIRTEKIEDNVYEIETPFLDRRNDFITIYAVLDNPNKMKLTDAGYTISDLKMSGLEFNTEKRKKELNTILNGFGIQLGNDEIYIHTTPENFAYKKHNLIQALLSINDMFVMAKNKVSSLFFEDVGLFFDNHDIRYISNVSIEGKSHLGHKFDFIIPKSKVAPERTIKLLNKPKKENLKATLFSFADTINIRAGKGYILLNDEGGVKQDLITAIQECNISPILWSHRNKYVTELAA